MAELPTALELGGLFEQDDLSTFVQCADSSRETGNTTAYDHNVAVYFGDGFGHIRYTFFIRHNNVGAQQAAPLHTRNQTGAPPEESSSPRLYQP